MTRVGVRSRIGGCAVATGETRTSTEASALSQLLSAVRCATLHGTVPARTAAVAMNVSTNDADVKVAGTTSTVALRLVPPVSSSQLPSASSDGGARPSDGSANVSVAPAGAPRTVTSSSSDASSSPQKSDESTESSDELPSRASTTLTVSGGGCAVAAMVTRRLAVRSATF